MNSCPACRHGELETFDEVRNDSGQFLLKICPGCLCIVNATAYEIAAVRSQEDIQRAAHYDPAPVESAVLHAEVEANWANLQNLVRLAGVDPSQHVFCDFGAGRGCASAAAARAFAKVFSVDLDVGQAQATAERTGTASRTEVVRSLEGVSQKIGFFFAWHVLEHLPEVTSFMSTLVPRLAPGATLAFQVPLFRPEYVLECHYIFYSEASFKRLAQLWGFAPGQLLRDVDRGFLTWLTTMRAQPLT